MSSDKPRAVRYAGEPKTRTIAVDYETTGASALEDDLYDDLVDLFVDHRFSIIGATDSPYEDSGDVVANTLRDEVKRLTFALERVLAVDSIGTAHSLARHHLNAARGRS